MKTSRCADSSSQLSESFVRELQAQGVAANNLAGRRRTTSKPVDLYDLPAEIYFAPSEEGDTHLHAMIVEEKWEAAAFLIGIAPRPSYLDIANDRLYTALHYAVLVGQSRVVRLLVLAGASTQARTRDGDTALHLAVQEGHLECIKALAEPMSNVERDWLAKSNVPRPLPQLSVQVDAKNYVGRTPLHVAASKNDVQLVHELLLIGADVNAREGLGGKTALHVAIEKESSDVVYYLAQIPKALLATTYAGEAAYQIAVECRPQYVETLLRYGAPPVMHSRAADDDEDSMSEDGSSDGDYDVHSYVDYGGSYSKAVNAAKLVVV